jgi:uncharacterized protein
MKQTANRSKDRSKAAKYLSRNVIPLFIIGIAIPVLLLVGLGLFSIYRDGYLLYFAGFLAVSAIMVAVPMLVMRRKSSKNPVPALENDLVEASGDWSDHDRQVWEELNRHIDLQLQQDSKWGALREHSLDLVLLAAKKYRPTGRHSELCFSAPELLKMVEEVSRRYRKTLKTHVPFVEKVPLSTLKTVYEHKEKTNTARKAYQVYRAWRIMTPAGMLAEVRSQLVGRVFGGISTELQHRLKQAFLQEVLSVAIDLYSGRFKVDDSEIETSRSALADQQRMAIPVDPLRVCLLGQVSAGKSAIINALTGDMVAEVSKLPSTENVEVHQCRIEGVDVIHLVDLPGLDGSDQTQQRLLREITGSDVVLWVLKANQSARQADTEFRDRLAAFYADGKNRSRKQPVFIGILNQVDRLKPLGEWEPPYDMDAPASPKARIIQEAIEYNKELMNFEALVPLSVSEDKPHYNLDILKGMLTEAYAAGIQAQLNRRRIESAGQFKLFKQVKPAIQGGKALFEIFNRKRAF